MNLEEFAHIIGQSEHGPRGRSELPVTKRDEYENIVLLCPKCHRLVDKIPDQFSIETLHDWKNRHEEAIRHLFTVPVYDTRAVLSIQIQKLLRKNKAIFLEYGPHSEHAADPLSDAVNMWRRYVLSEIIPNNRRIVNLLGANEHLLDEEEKEVVDKYVLHQQAFEYNHVSGEKISSAPLFPDEMNTILQENRDA